MLEGCVGIMQSPKLFAKVVPPDQNFDENYSGLLIMCQFFCLKTC